ncbi:S-adenosylmethionine decarboxylase proenzyme-like isoform X2 [Heterodontus francisci]|uniref:S-adenosylmethionine decarboxylase proenzyme-like isoform X2 n=1 Tax=Heterodontus francisci TaxID=7792 RepID=UPI00355B2FC8
MWYHPLTASNGTPFGIDTIEDIFYSHKNFIKPTSQDYPHRSFEEEIRSLDKLFPNGAAYCMGRIRSDCWYLYTLDISEGCRILQPDQTLKIVMRQLDPELMKQFFLKDGVIADDVTQMSGICDLIQESIIDATMFNPCGYSMNGLKADSSKCHISCAAPPAVDGFKRKDLQYAQFNNYSFVFASYVKH